MQRHRQDGRSPEICQPAFVKRAKRRINPLEKRYPIKEAAPLLGLHPQTVVLKCETGEILATKPGRKWEIPESAIAEYLSSKTVAVSEQTLRRFGQL